MSEKRSADPVEGQQRAKRSRFGPAQGAQNGSAVATSTPVAAQNGVKLPTAAPNPKAAELLAKKEALKAQLQALRVRYEPIILLYAPPWGGSLTHEWLGSGRGHLQF